MYKKEQLLRDTGLFVLGVEGTFFQGENLVDGALEFLEAVKKSKREFLFYTNQNSISKQEYITMLEQNGCHITENHILNSADVAIRYLLEQEPGKRVFLAGPSWMEEQFIKAGIQITEEGPEVVLVGADPEFSYEKLKKTCEYIENGALFYATHGEKTSFRHGQKAPDCGALCAAITAATGKEPRVLGLPHKEAVETIISHTGIHTDYIAFVGDRIDVEITAGSKHGMMGFLVLTGETALEDVFESKKKPDLIFASVGEMGEIIREWMQRFS